MVGISKYFPSTDVVACCEVDFSVDHGEIHALVGENGAGKTTLMNILYGLLERDAGRILLNEQEIAIHNPHEAIDHGIGMVHQHFQLVPSFTVAENVGLGAETARWGVIDSETEKHTVQQISDQFNLPINPDEVVGDLPVGLKQRVEILKALYRDIEILILDEPTAALTPQEADDLFENLRDLRNNGKSIIFISHKLPEVMKLADRVSVMRNGQILRTVDAENTSIEDLSRMMVGGEIKTRAPVPSGDCGSAVLEIEDLFVHGQNSVCGIGFCVRESEILGVAGVSGNGQLEMVEAITGQRPVEIGKILLNGKDITSRPVRDRREQGMVYIPEDRMVKGLNLAATLEENLIAINYFKPTISLGPFLRNRMINKMTKDTCREFAIQGTSESSIATLSGGNLQKVVLGRELRGDARVIVAFQPTRGLDVRSIHFVHNMLREARDQGAAIILVSYDLDEVITLSDRIIVLYTGCIVGELSRTEADEEKIGMLMTGGFSSSK
jgi:simple sugar transport system ATP-binding protein